MPGSVEGGQPHTSQYSREEAIAGKVLDLAMRLDGTDSFMIKAFLTAAASGIARVPGGPRLRRRPPG